MTITAAALARRFWMTRCTHPMTQTSYFSYLSRSEIEKDGRKVKKAVAALVKQGLVVLGERGAICIAPQVVESVAAVKPDLVAIFNFEDPNTYKQHDIRHGKLHGVTLDTLSTENLRWVAEHANDYVLLDEWGKTAPSYGIKYLRDSAFEAALNAHKASMEFETRYQENIAWGLVQLDLLSETDAKAFETNGSAFPFSDKTFTQEPAQWEEQLQAQQARLTKRIAEDVSRLRVLTETGTKIALYGGWDKFRADYKAALAKALAELEEKKKPTA